VNEGAVAHGGAVAPKTKKNKQTYLSMKSCHSGKGTNKTTVTFCQAFLLYLYKCNHRFLGTNVYLNLKQLTISFISDFKLSNIDNTEKCNFYVFQRSFTFLSWKQIMFI